MVINVKIEHDKEILIHSIYSRLIKSSDFDYNNAKKYGHPIIDIVDYYDNSNTILWTDHSLSDRVPDEIKVWITVAEPISPNDLIIKYQKYPHLIEDDIEKLSNSLFKVIPLSYDGMYIVKIIQEEFNKVHGLLIKYKFEERLSSFTEIFDNVKVSIPNAFKHPLLIEFTEPSWLDENSQLTQIGINPFNNLFQEQSFERKSEMNLNELMDELAEIYTALGNHGVEALGWYQSFHKYEREYWGIYLHSKRIEILALDLYEQFMKNNCGDYDKAIKVIIWKVSYHELFHYKLDAFSLSQELMANQPVYLKYKSDVYHKLAGTKEWLEELLANFFSYQSLTAALRTNDWSEKEIKIALDYIENLMDMAPNGYRHWRKGSDINLSRQLYNQIIHGVVQVKQPYVPLEKILVDVDKIIDLELDDIPFFTDKESTLETVLYAMPKIRKIDKVFRYFGMKKVNRPGKGRRGHFIYQCVDKPNINKIKKALGSKANDFIEKLEREKPEISLPHIIKPGTFFKELKKVGLTINEFVKIASI